MPSMLSVSRIFYALFVYFLAVLQCDSFAIGGETEFQFEPARRKKGAGAGQRGRAVAAGL